MRHRRTTPTLAAILLIAVTLTGCVGSVFRPERGQYTRARHRQWCEQAVKQGWCGIANADCRHRPPKCNKHGVEVPVGAAAGLTGGGVGR